MQTQHMRLADGRSLAQVLVSAGLDPEIRALAEGSPDPRAFVEALLRQGQVSSVLVLLAHALPRREAIWWGWLAAREGAGESPPPLVAQTLQATHAWISDPSDANRRAAMAAGAEAGFDSAASMVALSAFLSGSSLAPVDQAPIPPEPGSGAVALVGALTLASVDLDPEGSNGAMADLVRKGLAVADRVALWKAPPEGGARP